ALAPEVEAAQEDGHHRPEERRGEARRDGDLEAVADGLEECRRREELGEPGEGEALERKRQRRVGVQREQEEDRDRDVQEDEDEPEVAPQGGQTTLRARSSAGRR